jgi:cytochrome c oxidase subunit 2
MNFVVFDLCKLFGLQWYWCYFLCIDNIVICNLLLESDFFCGDLRMLQCNQVLVLLSLVMYKFWVSSCDVIHSFTIACLGVKVDCIPGRCNEVVLFALNVGLFYGQCSELCGVLHGFMPLSLSFL